MKKIIIILFKAYLKMWSRLLSCDHDYSFHFWVVRRMKCYKSMNTFTVFIHIYKKKKHEIFGLVHTCTKLWKLCHNWLTNKSRGFVTEEQRKMIGRRQIWSKEWGKFTNLDNNGWWWINYFSLLQIFHFVYICVKKINIIFCYHLSIYQLLGGVVFFHINYFFMFNFFINSFKK